jgi:hypothetical protein
MNVNGKLLSVVSVAAFLAGSFIASPELRAYAANTVRSIDIVDGEVKTADLGNNAVNAAKVKDGEIKAAEIATDAVGAAEIQGVTKLLFAKCSLTSAEEDIMDSPGSARIFDCNISGVASGDQAIATINRVGGNACFAITHTTTEPGAVNVFVKNTCDFSERYGDGTFFSLMVFRK